MDPLEKKVYYINFYSIFCRLSCFYREWPQLATILRSFDLSVETKLKPLTFDLKQAIHGAKNRLKTDIIDFLFHEDPSMRLASRSI